MTDITQRLSAQSGYFTLPDSRLISSKIIATHASRVVTPEHGQHGIPYCSAQNDDFWHLDPMNDWHITTILKDGTWHCLIQCRLNSFGNMTSQMIDVYASVIKHQVTHYHHVIN